MGGPDKLGRGTLGGGAGQKVIDGSQSGVNSRHTRCAASETSEAFASRVLCILATRKTQSLGSKPNVCGSAQWAWRLARGGPVVVHGTLWSQFDSGAAGRWWS